MPSDSPRVARHKPPESPSPNIPYRDADAAIPFPTVLPPEAITAAVDELTRDRSAMSLEAANREVYRLLKEGIPVSVMERDSTPGHTSSGLRPPSPQRGEGKGGQTTVRVRVIDWEPRWRTMISCSSASSAALARSTLYTCRPDLVSFINGCAQRPVGLTITFRQVFASARLLVRARTTPRPGSPTPSRCFQAGFAILFVPQC